MKKVLLLVVVVVLTLSGQVFAAIVYSGAQNVTLELQGGDAPAPQQAVISIAGSMASWDDFIVDLLFDNMMGTMAPMGMMSMGTSLLTISTAMGMGTGMGMGMGGIVGLGDLASNLLPGAMIGPSSPLINWGVLYGSGEFGEEGGYIGLMTGLGQYGWLHMAGQSNIGTSTHRVMFDGWAYDDQPGTPIGAGTIPAPGAVILGALGATFVAWLRRRRAL